MTKSERFWDKVANGRDFTRGSRTFKRIVERTREHLDVTDIVLDFGCGTGSLTLEFLGHAKEFHGIDTSSQMIAVAKAAAADGYTESLFFSQSGLFDDRLTQGTFDVILAFNVLHYLEDKTAALRRIHELLRSGGIFISSTGCLREKRTFLSLLAIFVSKSGLMPHTTLFRCAELRELVVNCGFSILNAEIINDATSDLFIAAKKSVEVEQKRN